MSELEPPLRLIRSAGGTNDVRFGLDEVPLAVVVLDVDGGATLTNGYWGLLTGLSHEASAGDGWIAPVHADDRRRLKRELSRRAQPRGLATVDCRIHDGESVRWTRWQWRTGLSPSDQVVIFIADIDDDRRRELELDRRASVDPLTGLPNRTQVLEHIRRSLGRLGSGREIVGILFVDLDHFKLINDAVGHQAGDDVLALVGERLRQSMRPEDLVGRVGGDEFVVVCRDLRAPADAQVVAQRVLDALGEPFEVAGGSWDLSAAIGIATTGNADIDPEALVARADQAMYEIKQERRGKAQNHPASPRPPLTHGHFDGDGEPSTTQRDPMGVTVSADIDPVFADAVIQKVFQAGLVLATCVDRVSPTSATRLEEVRALLDGIVQDLRAAAFEESIPRLPSDDGPERVLTDPRATLGRLDQLLTDLWSQLLGIDDGAELAQQIARASRLARSAGAALEPEIG
ncbi:MAG: diguanylate cyclase domain-containing protein [Acidimicrobiales bacterium]